LYGPAAPHALAAATPLTAGSNEVSASRTDGNAPTAVTLNDPTDVGSNQLTLSWTANADPDFKQYKIYRAYNPGVDETKTLVATIGARGNTVYINTGLNNNVTYYYKVYVYDTALNSTGSNEVSATTPQDQPPTGVSVTSPQAIGDIVRRTAEGVREASGDAVMSAAVFSNMRGGALQGQDPDGWASEGWMDVIIPMDYQMQSLQVRADERRFLETLYEDEHLLPKSEDLAVAIILQEAVARKNSVQSGGLPLFALSSARRNSPLRAALLRGATCGPPRPLW